MSHGTAPDVVTLSAQSTLTTRDGCGLQGWGKQEIVNILHGEKPVRFLPAPGYSIFISWPRHLLPVFLFRHLVEHVHEHCTHCDPGPGEAYVTRVLSPQGTSPPPCATSTRQHSASHLGAVPKSGLTHKKHQHLPSTAPTTP